MIWAAQLFTVINVGLGLFQLCLAFGAPWGRLAWGGSHERLPPRLRIGSLVAIGLYAGFSLIILSRAGVIPLWSGAGWTNPACWIIAGFLTLGVLGNLASRSRPERLVMTPIAAILAGCAVCVALG